MFSTIRIIFVVRIVILYLMKLNFLTSTIAGTLALSLLTIIIEMAFGKDFTAPYLGWLVLASALVVTILGIIIRNSVWHGLRLSLFVFLILFLIGHFNLLIEAYIFDVTDGRITLLKIIQGFLITLIFSPLLVYLFGKWTGDSLQLHFPTRSLMGWTWRIVAGDFLYVFCYLLAGMILYALYPKLMDFYGDKIPPFSIMIGTQFFRALVFIGVAILINRSTKLPLFQQALVIGAFFAIAGGVSPLIIPDNEYMPYYIRLGHSFEVGFSNSLFGFILTFLIGQKSGVEKSETEVPLTEINHLKTYSHD